MVKWRKTQRGNIFKHMHQMKKKYVERHGWVGGSSKTS